MELMLILLLLMLIFDPVYPYTPGPYYYGVAQGSGNLGPGSGHTTIPSNCTPYTGINY